MHVENIFNYNMNLGSVYFNQLTSLRIGKYLKMYEFSTKLACVATRCIAFTSHEIARFLVKKKEIQFNSTFKNDLKYYLN